MHSGAWNTGTVSESLPEAFCWTKFGTEAGEEIGAILARKDAERAANDGLFVWGIGNAIGPSVAALLAQTENPTVLFTPMLSRPAARDVSPQRIVEWTAGIGLDGARYELPDGIRVTSRTTSSRQFHYGLVCRSENALSTMMEASSATTFTPHHVVNLRSGNRVGASQVTSVVRTVARPLEVTTTSYRVAFTAHLVPPYVLRLTESR